MKKKLLSVLGVVAIMTLVAYASQVNNEEAELSDMALENAEALAEDINPMCPDGCLDPPGYCFCYGEYDLESYDWGDDSDHENTED